MLDIPTIQKNFCARHQSPFEPINPGSILGFALDTEGKLPVNGLRHDPIGHTNGWYIWCGEDFSPRADFFSPLCIEHVYENHPELIGALGLAPGFRFLIAGDHLDIWYDEALLDT